VIGVVKGVVVKQLHRLITPGAGKHADRMSEAPGRMARCE